MEISSFPPNLYFSFGCYTEKHNLVPIPDDVFFFLFVSICVFNVDNVFFAPVWKRERKKGPLKPDDDDKGCVFLYGHLYDGHLLCVYQ